MLMNDNWFLEMHLLRELKIIEPFRAKLVKEENGKKIVSYGLGSYGYDIRLDKDVYIIDGSKFALVDPKNFDKSMLQRLDVGVNPNDVSESYVIVPPNSYVLGSSVERFEVPRGVNGICVGKSTYARCGIIVNTTPLESEWEGYLTIEISNSSQSYVKLYIGEGIAQVMFIAGGFIEDKPEGKRNVGFFANCVTSYKDRKGKYQGQEGLTVARV